MIIQNSNVKSQKTNSKYERDLIQRCYQLSLDAIRYIDQLKQGTSSNVIAKQFLRSSTSIGANLVEAKASSSRIEFKKFHEISLKSANETKYWLGLFRDGHIGDKVEANRLIAETTEIANMLAAGIRKLKGL